MFVMRILEDCFVFAVEKLRQGDSIKAAAITNSLISVEFWPQAYI